MPADQIARLLAAEPGQTPAWAIWLFEKPLSSALVLGFAALIVVVILNQRGRKKQALIAGGLGAVLSGAVFLIGRSVTTEREQLIAGAREFVSAAARADSRGVRALLDDRLVVSVNGAPQSGFGKTQIVDIAGAMGHLEIERHVTRIDHVSVRRHAAGRTDIGVYVTTRSLGPATSTWRLEWTKAADDGWRIISMDWLSVNGHEPSWRMLLDVR